MEVGGSVDTRAIKTEPDPDHPFADGDRLESQTVPKRPSWWLT